MGVNYLETLEIWKDIEGYEGYYQISNLGRVKSLPRKVWCNGGFHISKEKILKQHKRKKDGYINIMLIKNKIAKIKFIHRLVAAAFIPNPENLPCVNHKDENPSNNHVENLEWCTQKYNMNYGTCVERRKRSFVKNNSFVKANATKIKNHSRGAEKSVYCISKEGNIVAFYESITFASKETNISKGHIGECCKHKRHSAGGYIWRYKDEND